MRRDVLFHEAQEGWHYCVSDEVAYAGEVVNGERLEEGPSYIEDYISGNIWFEVITYPRGDAFGDDNFHVAWTIKAHPEARIPWQETDAHLAEDDGHDPMFVSIRQHTEEGKEFQFRPIRSVIWLKRFDGSTCLRHDASDSPQAPVGKPLLPVVNREGDSSGLLVRQGISTPFGMSHSECPSDMVKRLPEIPDNITDDKPPIVATRKNRVNVDPVNSNSLDYCPQELAGHLQFALFADGDLWAERRPHAASQRLDVYIRSLELEAGATKGMLRGVVQSRHGSRENPTDPEGARDSRAQAKRLYARPQEGCEAKTLNFRQREEVASETAPASSGFDWTAKHTHFHEHRQRPIINNAASTVKG